MTLKDLLRKKEKIDKREVNVPAQPLPHASEFTFIRTDTHTQDVINFPTYKGDSDNEGDRVPALVARPSAVAAAASAEAAAGLPDVSTTTSPPRKHFRRLRGFSKTSVDDSSITTPKEHKRLSERLSLGHKKSDSTSSINIPSDLPEIHESYGEKRDQQEAEAQWEERATRLAGQRSVTPTSQPGVLTSSPRRSRSPSLSDPHSDVNIQEAIRLHEAGQLEQATKMFHELADQGNVLSQVLYGLSLRHGWGCTPAPEQAVHYLSSAASNSASIEAAALNAGLKKGGAAKGELVLAIFELGNCFRYGWGVPIDKPAARQYYETAANLGDTDAMNEAAWCYLEGFGGKKDKFKAAQLLRLAEKNGSKILGNTWIWKDKYNPA